MASLIHRVIVAGAGALGCEVLKNLGLARCPSVVIADPDRLEQKNIDRSVLLQEDARIDETKVEAALRRLRHWFPATEWSGYAVEIADLDSACWPTADLLLSCVDNELARIEVAVLAAHYDLPVCDAGLGGTSVRMGRVSWFPAAAGHIKQTACFACLLSASRRATLLSLGESPVHACWMEPDPQQPHQQPRWSSSPTVCSMVAALQVEVAMTSQDLSQPAHTIHLDLDRDPITWTTRHPRSADCPLHARAGDLPFPICVLARCLACGQRFAPRARLGWVRSRGCCPHCGARQLEVLEIDRSETCAP